MERKIGSIASLCDYHKKANPMFVFRVIAQLHKEREKKNQRRGRRKEIKSEKKRKKQSRNRSEEKDEKKECVIAKSIYPPCCLYGSDSGNLAPTLPPVH